MYLSKLHNFLLEPPPPQAEADLEGDAQAEDDQPGGAQGAALQPGGVQGAAQGNLLKGIVIWFVIREGIEPIKRVFSSLYSNMLFIT